MQFILCVESGFSEPYIGFDLHSVFVLSNQFRLESLLLAWIVLRHKAYNCCLIGRVAVCVTWVAVFSC
uniref:Uncharacterized protein n=1 Tax=Rhizophora mucronata TaxID=61149 RepID=A0A2P2NGV3_RHIMU